jgi:AcrR family transcriptional regulator
MKKMDRRVKKTRTLLKNGLITLMQEKSIKEITVQELVDLVDINRSTFYLHYKDIYDLVEQLEQEVFDSFKDLINNFGEKKRTNNS